MLKLRLVTSGTGTPTPPAAGTGPAFSTFGTYSLRHGNALDAPRLRQLALRLRVDLGIDIHEPDPVDVNTQGDPLPVLF